jgi:N,N'-diacetyllegionaminate synthase
VSTFIIAEAGVNHNGSIDLAYKLIDLACEAGANAIKFQTFKAKNLILKNTSKADYQIQAENPNESQYDMLKKLELADDDHIKLINYCNKKGIIFLSSPFDIESIDLLNNLKLKTFKIPSGEITNLPYLKRIGSLNKNIILSTGMSTIKEIGDALAILIGAGASKTKITILHANSMYPTPMVDVNLKAMLAIKNEFEIAVGYSDHTLGIEVDIAAVAMGATVIEKHFTLDKTMVGPDHKASLDPNELKEMVTAIRNIEKALGDGIKKVTESEKPNIDIVRKSITAKCQIKKGDVFTEDNLITKRPGGGISPMEWYNIVGKVAVCNYLPDQQI